jgi:hypothetical protein
MTASIHELRDNDTVYFGVPCGTDIKDYSDRMKRHFRRLGVDIHAVVLVEAPQVITVVRAIPAPSTPPPPTPDELARVETALRRHNAMPKSAAEYRALATQILLELKGLA